MGSIEWLTVPVSQLEFGLPLRYDIYNHAGDHLANAGDEFSQSLKASWLQLGFDKVFAKVCAPIEDESLLEPYNQQAMMCLQDNLELVASVVLELAASRGEKLAVTSMEFDEITTDILKSIQIDSAAALLVLAKSIQQSQTDDDKLLADRCSQLSILSMTIAFEMGLVPSECNVVGTAAMLHDLSLLGSEISEDIESQQETYRQHPTQSSNIVDTILGINPKVTMATAQVHERPFGDGFPRGLRANRITPAAKIIGLADTFLTLTSSKQHTLMPMAKNFHPADAIGYIMYHAALGQFEIEAVRSLIRASSLYPVGSRVQLSDESSAVVFRSSRNAPSKPIVRLDSDETLVDLRHSSVAVRGPDRSSGNLHPLFKSELSQVMWG